MKNLNPWFGWFLYIQGARNNKMCVWRKRRRGRVQSMVVVVMKWALLRPLVPTYYPHAHVPGTIRTQPDRRMPIAKHKH